MFNFGNDSFRRLLESWFDLGFCWEPKMQWNELKFPFCPVRALSVHLFFFSCVQCIFITFCTMYCRIVLSSLPLDVRGVFTQEVNCFDCEKLGTGKSKTHLYSICIWKYKILFENTKYSIFKSILNTFFAKYLYLYFKYFFWPKYLKIKILFKYFSNTFCFLLEAFLMSPISKLGPIFNDQLVNGTKDWI